MQGLHLTADLYLCECDPALLTQAGPLSALCRQHTLDAGLTLVAEKWHTFPDFQGQPGGVTGMLLLAESHLALHTWPERGAVTLDVYVCNFIDDNSAKAQKLLDDLLDAFKPGKVQRERLIRGDEQGADIHGETLLESISPSSVYGFQFARRLLTRQTRYQKLEILESAELGRTLRLDDHFMTSEADEFFYHEALIHPAALSHPAPRKALIVGGGDGGALEELLKHPSLEHVSLVELDDEVIQVSREYLQPINKNAFDDPRVIVHILDGADYLANATDKFDLIYLDLTDPETPAGPLYTQAFFEQCQNRLAPDGALVLHLGSPFHEPEQVRSLAATLQRVFAGVHAYGLHIPLYGTYWALAIASNSLDPRAITTDTLAQRLKERALDPLQYYNPEVHGALFALPNYYRKLLR